MKQRDYNAGDIILKEGDPSDVVYKIVSGDVEVFKEQNGQKIVLGVMKAGEFLGEMGVVDDEPRSASARAKNKVSMIIYEEEEFFRLISRDGSSAERMILRLCERVRTLSRKLAEITVSIGTTDAIQDQTSGGEPQSLPAQTRSKSESTKVRLTLFPLSQQLIPSLSDEGITVMKLPFSVGRLPVGKEPGPAVPIDLAISDSRPFRLSRQHFAFYQNPKGCGILDLGSALGTEVNGVFVGHNFGKDFEYLRLGENEITAGGVGSPFTFKVLVESA
ncbi:MAG: cyclic nucleotide-binding domain-containing protein [Desulfobacteraceae bacterium]|jgi:CRP-like cAMP-binding protein